MAWARISDDFHDHPKVAELTVDAGGLAALGLWTLALTWVRADRRRGSFVPFGIAVRLSAGSGKQLASRLVQSSLWDEVEGGYSFHDFEDVYDPDGLSEKRKVAGRAGGKASGQARAAKAAASNTEATCFDDASTSEAKHDEATYARAGTTTHYPEASKEASKDTRASNSNGRHLRAVNGSTPNVDADPHFVAFWNVYPLKKAKGQARRAWPGAVRKAVDPALIVAAAQKYRDDPERTPKFTAYPATWLNGERWNDQPAEPPPAAQRPFWEN